MAVRTNSGSSERNHRAHSTINNEAPSNRTIAIYDRKPTRSRSVSGPPPVLHHSAELGEITDRLRERDLVTQGRRLVASGAPSHRQHHGILVRLATLRVPGGGEQLASHIEKDQPNAELCWAVGNVWAVTGISDFRMSALATMAWSSAWLE